MQTGDASPQPIAPPIFQTAAFSAEPAVLNAQSGAIHPSHFYTRYGNPTHSLVERRLAELEGGEAALLFASGMSAMTSAILSVVGTGDHIVAQRECYGGTVSLLSLLSARFGIDVTYIRHDGRPLHEHLRAAARNNTKLILIETPSNPLMRVTDLGEVASFARNAGILTIADNTLASPINQNPLMHGIDIVMHSATKYLGGHGDVTAGALVSSRKIIAETWRTAFITGGCSGPVDSWLLLRGMQTLELRMAHQNATALKIAEWLEASPDIRQVHYAGLRSSAGHEVAAAQMRGFGGVVSFELGGDRDPRAFISKLRCFRSSASFGAHCALVIQPAAMWASALSSEALDEIGVSQSLVRIGVGLESAEELIADIRQALGK